MELTLKEAKNLYPTASAEMKTKFEAAFGKDSFRTITYKDIKTFEDACEALDIDPDAVCCDVDTLDEIAYKRLKIIVKAINQGWEPDWDNTNQRKWYPWFKLSSGFGFGDSDYDCDFSDARVGSRLCFESEEKSSYAGKQFLSLYEEFLTIKK
jgi:hypothetical protein